MEKRKMLGIGCLVLDAVFTFLVGGMLLYQAIKFHTWLELAGMFLLLMLVHIGSFAVRRRDAYFWTGAYLYGMFVYSGIVSNLLHLVVGTLGIICMIIFGLATRGSE